MDDDRPIVVVDDDGDLRAAVAAALGAAGMDVRQAVDGVDGLRLAAECEPSVAVVEVALPGVSGLEVCRRLRADRDLADVGVLFLSRRAEELDRVLGFEAGGDDYVAKETLSIRELVLRVSALRRRSARRPQGGEWEIGGLRLDVHAHRAWCGPEALALTPTEFRLLRTLAERPGRACSRGELLRRVWGMAPDLNTRTVDTHVRRLREKLGACSAALQTVRGVGYRLAMPAEPVAGR